MKTNNTGNPLCLMECNPPQRTQKPPYKKTPYSYDDSREQSPPLPRSLHP
ncbi:hypothetical protein [Salinibacter phage M8CC-19]|uniref:Uncharacterized protein n=2 Tax=Kryptosalinivirus M8CC19 TaxID=2560720 RepID=A0A2I6UGA2_9CAUD|nr:hypothetical protein FGG63_gp68 [Salinibacter phage M8CC-19]AUO79023.1 hypothetical protein [Salinibacter phage M8CC-19]AUO79256.1 hypothetical protein [Salinibacter phage M31CC-1]